MSEKNKDQSTIKIGFISGFNSPYGLIVKNQFKGAQLAIDEVNRTGGILGKQIELVAKDDQMKVDLAAAAAHELIDNGADLLMGTLSASTVTEVNRIAKAAGIPLMGLNQVSAITSAPEMGPFTFHEGLTPYITAQLIGRWGLKNLNKRWLFIVPDYQWGHEAYAGFVDAMKKGGGTDIGVIKIPLGSTEEDFAKHFPDILAKKPDVLSVTNLGSDQLNFIKGAHKTGLEKEMTILHTVSDIPIIESAKIDELVGMYWGVNFYWSLEDHNESARTFVKSFRTMFPDDYPSGYAAYAYSGALEFLFAAQTAGEYPLNYQKMTQALEGRTYDHYKGPQWWRPCDHQSFQDFYILRFKGPETSKHKYDIGEIVGSVSWDLDVERSCEALGLEEFKSGHFKEPTS